MKLSTESTAVNDSKLNTDITEAQTTADEAKDTATQAKTIADNTNQYFWFASTGTDTGAHITEVSQSQFVTNPSGGNLLARSNGIAVRDGLTELATFSADGANINRNGASIASFGETARIGKASGAHTTIDEDGMQIYSVDSSDNLVELANIGYGEGTAESGTAIAPYYTFGTRASGSTIGTYSHAEGYGVTASGSRSHAEGYNTTAQRTTSHAEGSGTTASGNRSHAEGGETTASGAGSHAEGQATTASGDYSHAEGNGTTASGAGSHAEGQATTASGNRSHAEGHQTTASGLYSHAQGFNTTARGMYQTAIGAWNVLQGAPEDKSGSDHAFIIGNGSASGGRSNAFAVAWNGNTTASGTIEDGSGNRLDTVGTTTAVSDSTKSIANNATTWQATNTTVTLTKGTWLLIGGASFPSNATGKRAVRWYNTTSSSAVGDSSVQVPAVSGGVTLLQSVATVTLTATATYRIELLQNSGSALNCTTSCKCMKFHN